MSRKKSLPVVIALVLTLAVAIPTALAGNGKGNRNGKPTAASASATLVATPNELRAGDHFDVSGCGYDTSLGNVVLGFGGGSWGSPLDAAGCFTIPHIPVGGDNPTPGTYPVTAYQYVKSRWTAVAQTTVTILP